MPGGQGKFLRDLHLLGSDLLEKKVGFPKDAIMNFMCDLFLKREFNLLFLFYGHIC